MNQSLADLVKKKVQVAAGSPIDWDERRNKYLAAVEELYHQIAAAFQEAVTAGTVAIQRRPRAITENYLGTYTATDLLLFIGHEQVRFAPRGRNVGGAAGRVDVLGERAEAVLIYQPETGWAFVQERYPTLRVIPLDEATLTEVLQLVMRD